MSDIIARTMQHVAFIKNPTYEDYLATDAEARKVAGEYVSQASM